MPIKLTRDSFKWTNGRGHNQKPILYSQKNNTLGLGNNPHSSDQWWLKAFDTQLQTLSVSAPNESGSISVTQTAPANNALGIAKTTGYYIRFVKGGVLTGSLERSVDASVGVVTEKEERKERKERKEKREKKEKKEKEREKEGKEKRKRKEKKGKDSKKSKEERRARKRMKRLVEKELAALKSP